MSAALALAVIGGCGGTAHRADPKPGAASPGVQAFVSRAQRALNGRFVAIYTLSPIPPFGQPGAGREHVLAVAAQSGSGSMVYREPSGRGFEEVLDDPRSAASGLYGCERSDTTGPWTCVGPDNGMGMTDIHSLIAPYPPGALLSGLQNAVSGLGILTGLLPGAPTARARATVEHGADCLTFDHARLLVGRVCLNRAGMISSYDLPFTLTDAPYSQATLDAVRTDIPRSLLELPAEPRPDNPLAR